MADLLLNLLRSAFDLCGNRARFFDSNRRCDFARLRAAGVVQKVGSRLGRLERYDDSSISFRFRRELNVNQAQPSNGIPLPHLEPGRVLRVRRREDSGDHDQRDNAA